MINYSYHKGDESQTHEADTSGQPPGRSRALSLYSTGNQQVALALRVGSKQTRQRTSRKVYSVYYRVKSQSE